MNSLRDIKRPPPIVKALSVSPSKSGSILHQKEKSFVESATSVALQLITEPEDDSEQPSVFATAAGPFPNSLKTQNVPKPSISIPSVLLPHPSTSTLADQNRVASSKKLNVTQDIESKLDAKKTGWDLIIESISGIPIFGPIIAPMKPSIIVQDFNLAIWSCQSKTD